MGTHVVPLSSKPSHISHRPFFKHQLGSFEKRTRCSRTIVLPKKKITPSRMNTNITQIHNPYHPSLLPSQPIRTHNIYTTHPQQIIPSKTLTVSASTDAIHPIPFTAKTVTPITPNSHKTPVQAQTFTLPALQNRTKSGTSTPFIHRPTRAPRTQSSSNPPTKGVTLI